MKSIQKDILSIVPLSHLLNNSIPVAVFKDFFPSEIELISSIESSFFLVKFFDCECVALCIIFVHKLLLRTLQI